MTAAQSLSNLILVSPQAIIGYQPQNAPITSDGNTYQQPPALLFHYEGEQTVMLESDITDHYVENNSAIQDQIALRPEVITTHGFIGELNNIAPVAAGTIQSILDKLTLISGYSPALTITALVAYNNAFQAYQTGANAVNAAVSAWSSINGITTNNQNKQQVAFQLFYGYWRARTLFTVQTPWAVFQDMAIKTLRAIQDDKTRTITDFEVTFKMMRFASTKTSSGIAAIQQNRAASQGFGLVNNGTQSVSNGPSLGVNTALTNNFPGGF